MNNLLKTWLPAKKIGISKISAYGALCRYRHNAPSVVIRYESETIKLYERDILYVESLLHYIVIHTVDREYRLKENLSDFACRLSDDFYQTHRSYYVSLKHIVRISRTSVTMDGGYEIPLSRGKYDDINRAFIERN